MSNHNPGTRVLTIGVPLLILAFATATGAVPAHAASEDDRRAQREAKRAGIESRRAEQQARRDAQMTERRQQRDARVAARDEREAFCQRIADWLSSGITETIPSEVLARRFGGGPSGGSAGTIPYESWLLQDARFTSAFGSRYDEVPVAEQQRLRDAGNNCKAPRNERGQAIADNMLFYRAFNEPYRARYVQGVVAIRNAHEQVDAAIEDLRRLRGDEDGARRFREHAARQAVLAEMLAEGSRNVWRQAFADAYQRALLPWHTERLRQAAASAKGFDGLSMLFDLEARMMRDADAAGATVQAPPELRARQTALAQTVVDEERVRIDALGSGVVGLARGVKWHEDATQRYGRISQVQAELREMFSHFETRRGAVLDAAQPELLRLIGGANDETELQRLIATYIPLETDGRRRSGMALLQEVALQREDLHKRRILGSATEVAASAATGEPSVSDMYDAFNAGLQAINREARQTAERCNNREFNRGQGDPVLAMQCLQFGVGVGVTHDGQNVASPQFAVSSFRKIACEKAQGEAGYRCDYVAGMSGNLNLPPSVAAWMRNGEITQARFVRQGTGWLLIP